MPWLRAKLRPALPPQAVHLGILFQFLGGPFQAVRRSDRPFGGVSRLPEDANW